MKCIEKRQIGKISYKRKQKYSERTIKHYRCWFRLNMHCAICVELIMSIGPRFSCSRRTKTTFIIHMIHIVSITLTKNTRHSHTHKTQAPKSHVDSTNTLMRHSFFPHSNCYVCVMIGVFFFKTWLKNFSDLNRINFLFFFLFGIIDESSFTFANIDSINRFLTHMTAYKARISFETIQDV